MAGNLLAGKGIALQRLSDRAGGTRFSKSPGNFSVSQGLSGRDLRYQRVNGPLKRCDSGLFHGLSLHRIGRELKIDFFDQARYSSAHLC